MSRKKTFDFTIQTDNENADLYRGDVAIVEPNQTPMRGDSVLLESGETVAFYEPLCVAGKRPAISGVITGKRVKGAVWRATTLGLKKLVNQ